MVFCVGKAVKQISLSRSKRKWSSFWGTLSSELRAKTRLCEDVRNRLVLEFRPRWRTLERPLRAQTIGKIDKHWSVFSGSVVLHVCTGLCWEITG